MTNHTDWYDSPGNSAPAVMTKRETAKPLPQSMKTDYVINSSQLEWDKAAWRLEGYASELKVESGHWPKYVTITSRKTGRQRILRYLRAEMDGKLLLWADYTDQYGDGIIFRIYND